MFQLLLESSTHDHLNLAIFLRLFCWSRCIRFNLLTVQEIGISIYYFCFSCIFQVVIRDVDNLAMINYRIWSTSFLICMRVNNNIGTVSVFRLSWRFFLLFVFEFTWNRRTLLWGRLFLKAMSSIWDGCTYLTLGMIVLLLMARSILL